MLPGGQTGISAGSLNVVSMRGFCFFLNWPRELAIALFLEGRMLCYQIWLLIVHKSKSCAFCKKKHILFVKLN